MSVLFRNPEFKSALLKLGILQLAFAMVIFFFVGYQLTFFHQSITAQNEALLGKVLTLYPEASEELANLVTREAAQDEIHKGQEVLSQYGYRSLMPVSSQPVLKRLYGRLRWSTAALAAVFLLPMMLFIGYEYKGVYSKVGRVYQAAERVVDGDFTASLPEDEEGEFGILGHQFNQMALRLKKSLESLKEDKLFLKNIISDISHQLKTPLSSLIMFNELMINDRNMTEKTRRDFLDKSQSQLERMEWLILNLLKMARLEAGAITFRKETTLLVEPARKAAASLAAKIDQKNLNVQFEGQQDSTWFSGDEEWMTEALINILKNSIEHTPEGGRIQIHVSETPLLSRISVKDNGEGIERKDIPHVFDRFYRGSNVVKVESVGIGLALTRLIVEGQGGSISVESQKGEGTTFIITFLKGVI